MNVLEVNAVKLAILTINKQKSLKAVYFQTDNKVLCMWKQIDSLEIAETHQTGNFAQNHFNKCTRGGECTK